MVDKVLNPWYKKTFAFVNLWTSKVGIPTSSTYILNPGIESLFGCAVFVDKYPGYPTL
jgi:hypothetical protein